MIPTAKSHTVGVGAVIREGNTILVIRERFMQGFKLPGGHIDPNEQITEAIRREVFEETGIKMEFESIANLGHFTHAQFGESNLYIICTGKALSQEICIHDTDEIIEAKWMEISEFLSREDTNNYNRMIVQTVINTNHPKLTQHKVPLQIKTPYELFF